jgi:DNA-binding MarR family transcriptional regulator
MRRYTKRSAQVLRFIDGYEERNGFAPTGDEIAAKIKVSRARAYQIIDQMETEGLIVRPRIGGKVVGRGLRLSEAALKLIEENA